VDGAIDRHLLTVLEASPYFTTVRGQNALDARHVAGDLAQQVRRVKATRLLIDAATSLVPAGAPAAAVEDFLRSLVASLEDNLGCTTVLTARTSDRQHTSTLGPAAERLVSGVIELTMDAGDPLKAEGKGQKAEAGGGVGGRSLLIRKMRGAPSALGQRPFDIVEGQGLVIR
jgi:KaiC/GvpD/RAD55 family RecA-like ATPase